jgi:hypothetical protein
MHLQPFGDGYEFLAITNSFGVFPLIIYQDNEFLWHIWIPGISFGVLKLWKK